MYSFIHSGDLCIWQLKDVKDFATDLNRDHFRCARFHSSCIALSCPTSWHPCCLACRGLDSYLDRILAVNSCLRLISQLFSREDSEFRYCRGKLYWCPSSIRSIAL